jgi:hypothetical protein
MTQAWHHSGAAQLPGARQEDRAGLVPHGVGGRVVPILQVLPRLLAVRGDPAGHRDDAPRPQCGGV